MSKRKFIRLLVYPSKLNTWGLAIEGRDSTTAVLSYHKTSDAAQTHASKLFNQPLKWNRKGASVDFQTDHDGVFVGCGTDLLFARLWLS